MEARQEGVALALERLQHGLQPAGADALVEVVGKGLQIDVGGVHVAVELDARPGVHVARGDGDRLQPALTAGIRDVHRVLHEDHGVVIGEGQAPAAEPHGCLGDLLG